MKKRIIVMFIMILVTMLCPLKISLAKMISINEISESFNNGEFSKYLEEFGGSLVSSVNTENKTIDFAYELDGKSNQQTFHYTDGFIEYTGEDIEITEANYETIIYDDMLRTLYFSQILSSIFELAGYPNKTLSDNVDYSSTFNEYGIELNKKPYSVKGDDFSASGDYMLSFRISLDSTKIDALVTKYGEDINKEEINNYYDKINNNNSKKESKSTELKSEDDKQNPNTGSFIEYGLISLGLLFTGYIFYITRKKHFIKL